MSRVRFCISASHTREDLQWALDELNEIGELLMIKYDAQKVK
jgi:serine palmitoyltransferase